MTLPYIVLLYGGIAYINNSLLLSKTKVKKNKIKVLELIPSMGDGGAQQIVLNYLNDFKNDKRIDSKLLVLENKTNSKYDNYLSKGKYDVDYLNIPKNYSKIKALNGIKRTIALNIIISKYIKKYQPDVVHVHMSGTVLFCIYYMKKYHNIMNFVTVHNNPLREKGLLLKVIRYVLRFKNVKLVCVNREQSLLAKKHFNIDSCEIVRNGIDISGIKKEIISKTEARKKYKIPQNAFLVIGVGRLNKIKRYDILINAFSRVLKEKKNAILAIAGDGEERTNLEKLARKLRIINRVRFLGNQSSVIPLYCAADVMVVSSETESASLVLVESQVCGTRCVISNGTPDESIVSDKVLKLPSNASINKWKNAIINNRYKGKEICNLEEYEVHGISKKMADIYLKYYNIYQNGEGNKVFLITIDTEADNQWDSTHECTTENAKYLPRFQELAEKYNFKPTWLTTYEMANDDYFVNYFKKKQDNKLCEIGMHLHAWNTPPEYKLEAKTNERSYLIEYPIDIMDEKIDSIDKLLTNKFDVKPISHRAGRWAMNDDYFMLLEKYGYKIDCSYTPHVNWNNSLGQTGLPGSNYLKVKENTHIYNNIVEVPMTIRRTYQIHMDQIKNPRSLLGEIKRFILGRSEWMRPNKHFNYSGLKSLIKNC